MTASIEIDRTQIDTLRAECSGVWAAERIISAERRAVRIAGGRDSHDDARLTEHIVRLSARRGWLSSIIIRHEEARYLVSPLRSGLQTYATERAAALERHGLWSAYVAALTVAGDHRRTMDDRDAALREAERIQREGERRTRAAV